MTFYTYTNEIPDDEVTAKIGFYALPRSVLLPPYLANNQYFVDYTDAIDNAFDDTVEAKLFALKNIRSMWTTGKGTEATIQSGQMIDITNWLGPDHSTVVQQVNLLGMRLSTAELIDELGYSKLSKFLGSYWFDKGRQSTIDFMNFCLGTKLELIPLWTQDYKTFVPWSAVDGPIIGDNQSYTLKDCIPTFTHSRVGGWVTSDRVGVPLQTLLAKPVDRGLNPWFPTTHVQITDTSNKLPLDVVGKLFYEICNYNLVIESVTTPIPASVSTNIVAMAMTTNKSAAFSALHYPLVLHSSVGGWTGGVGNKLFQVSLVPQ